MTKNEMAEILEQIGTLLELKGENPFKIRAYASGARALEAIEESELDRLIADESLQSVKGIGEALAQKITELRTTGKLVFFEKLQASIEPGLVELLQIPGLGPKKIRALHGQLGIASIAALSEACRAGRVAELAGFGEKTQQKLLEGIANREAYGRRHLWWDAYEVAAQILLGLRALPDVVRAEHAGSLRRGLETVGDLDFIVAARQVAPVVDWFCAQPGVKEVTARGETKASVRFSSGLQADLRLVPEDQFVFALHHFTGSKAHNVEMRQRALARGLSLSEWGLVSADGEGTVKEKVGAAGAARMVAEADLFAALGLRFIPPELREGMGEIEWAERADLPRLVEESDLRGAFHNHTTASDGRNTLAEMTAAAEALGWEYLGIADHSKSSFQANGLSEERLLRQVEEIRRFERVRAVSHPCIFGHGVRHPAGWPPGFRRRHAPAGRLCGGFGPQRVHPKRGGDDAPLIRAIEHPLTTMLGHVTGRLLLRREGYKLDFGKVIDAAIAHGVIIELNASPWRLDLDWRHWHRAAERGLVCSINPDAHETSGLLHVKAGVLAARKGWLTRDAILTTRPLRDVTAYLQRRR
jgi:DNA polymerase (family 10)